MAVWRFWIKTPRGPRRTPIITPAKVPEVIHKTMQENPDKATHWSTRAMAAAVGLSEKSVRRIWQKHGLKPHLARTFKVSNDPEFAEKLEAIIGLYLKPPEHAIVLSADEKSQIQALDCTQPGLPLKKGRCGTMTHDYKRNGTATLFAAMNTLDGTVISMCDDRHRHQEWLKFLRVIDQVTPRGKEIYLIADNYSAHKHPKVQKWLARHRRFHVYFTPISRSWLNMVERFFRDLTHPTFSTMEVGTSKSLNGVLSRIAKVSPTDSTVLITGETGTGKELIARAIHKRSRRSGYAFVSVNCATLAPSLIPFELFGHERGAFTGATQRRLGRFELAEDGTIFLDEVGELLPDTQVALLRVL